MTDVQAIDRMSAMETHLQKIPLRAVSNEAGSEMADTGPDRRTG